MIAAIGDRARALPERYGRGTLVLLALILLVGLGLRARAVVDPVAEPADDSHAYYGLAKALYEEGSYGGPTFHDSSDWSPGAPLLYAASFYATGGPREGTARIVEALLGLASIVVVFLLGERLGGRGAGLLAALGVALYPPFIHSTGELMSEPPATFTLPAAILAFLWAEERRSAGAWLLPGLLFGLTALIRPEYLLVAAAFVVLAALRRPFAPRSAPADPSPQAGAAEGEFVETRAQHGNGQTQRREAGWWRRWRPGLAGAALMLLAVLVPIVPWTVRNAVVLGRLVPISTGGGKALYVGTFLPADGEYQRVKAILYRRQTGRSLPPDSQALNRVDPVPLFDRVAHRYADLPRDSALGKIGKQNFSHWFGDDPLGYLGMTARKVGRMWSSGVGAAMSSTGGRVVQLLLVALGLCGFALLALRRRWWEVVVLAAPIVLVTAVGAVSLAAPRRNEVLMTLVFPLAALALTTAWAALFSKPPWSPRQASSQPS